MFSMLSKVRAVCVISGVLAMASIEARSVNTESENADFFSNARGLNTNFPLVEALPKIDTEKPSQFNMSSLENLFNSIYISKQRRNEDKQVTRNMQLEVRTGDHAVETDRQARAGFYYSPDDRHLFPLLQESESLYSQYFSQLYSPQPHVSRSAVDLAHVAESVPSIPDTSFEAEGRFFAWPGNSIVAGGVGGGITTGPINVPTLNAGAAFGPQSGFTGIRKMFAITRPPVYNINIPTTHVQATPLVAKPIGLPYGLSLANLFRAPITNNDNVWIAPSYNSAGVGLFKGLARL